MPNVNTFINHQGVNTYSAKLHLYDGCPHVDGINDHDNTGNTPLMYAIQFTNEEIATLLLKKGANINAKNFVGDNVMSFAIKRKSPELVNFLLQNGADNESIQLAIDFLFEYTKMKDYENYVLELEAKERGFREKKGPLNGIKYNKEYIKIKEELDKIYEDRKTKNM